MTATEKHSEFVKKLYDVLNEFHKQNPDLFVTEIHISHERHATGRKVLSGMSAKIEVQPCDE